MWFGHVGLSGETEEHKKNTFRYLYQLFTVNTYVTRSNSICSLSDDGIQKILLPGDGWLLD